jgi:tRNA(fMet)-specific endonuclease VapC
MAQFLLDTDHLTLLEFGHPPLLRRLVRQPPTLAGVSAATVEEALRGRVNALGRATDGPMRIRRYAQLLQTVQLLHCLELVPFDQPAEDQSQHLRGLRLRIGTQDLKIAAVALANRLTLLTRNRRDFARVPGLVLDDWTV